MDKAILMFSSVISCTIVTSIMFQFWNNRYTKGIGATFPIGIAAVDWYVSFAERERVERSQKGQVRRPVLFLLDKCMRFPHE